jgi:ATP-binding cassette, subfamily G (WHITE), member 2, PDR
MTATELNSATSSTAEFLVFRRGKVPKYMQDKKGDEETSTRADAQSTGLASANSYPGVNDSERVEAFPTQRAIFTWRNVTLDISIKGEPRRLLDQVSGWVKPRTLTALMGVAGAGRTTLLDTLSQRTTVGELTGDMLINGKTLDQSFQRKTGYVQQQDLHLETTRVR